uniref:Zinc finger, FYVE domain containing 27 n=1 Tax=Oryzias sinensis TaxID=183150 RepID=A0A8C8DZ44_9TELE
MAVLTSGTCQEPPQGSGGQGELAHSSKDTPGSADTFELGSPRCSPNLDLLNMVVSYKRMAVFLEPLVDVVDVIGFLWKMPLCSLSVWIFLNVFFCTVSEAGWFTLSMMGVLLPAALGYLQDRCGNKRPEDELQRRRIYAVQSRDLQTVQMTKQEAMMEVKELLKHLDDSLSSACQSAESVYKLLYWDDYSISSRFYGALLMLVCLLYVAPVGWVLAALTSASFLWNRDFCRVLLDLRRLFLRGQNSSSEGVCVDRELGSLMERTPTPTSLEVGCTCDIRLIRGLFSLRLDVGIVVSALVLCSDLFSFTPCTASLTSCAAFSCHCLCAACGTLPLPTHTRTQFQRHIHILILQQKFPSREEIRQIYCVLIIHFRCIHFHYKLRAFLSAARQRISCWGGGYYFSPSLCNTKHELAL